MKTRRTSVAIHLFAFSGLACILLLFAVIAGGLVYAAFRGGTFTVFSALWAPAEGSYGILPMLGGTVLTAAVATALAIPLAFGILSCIWIYNIRFLRALLRFMSGIPTVVYGFCGLFILVPLFRNIWGGTGYSVFIVAVVLCLLILPTMTIIADSAFHSLLGQSGPPLTTAALGIKKEKSFLYIALYTQRKWLLSAVMLSFGRAMGDTLIALMLSGNTPIMPEGLFSSGRTLSGHISLLTATDITPEIEFTLFLSCFILFMLSMIFSIIVRSLRSK